MLFGKEKIHLEDLIYGLISNILRIPSCTYEQYIQADTERVLSESEFTLFNDQILDFRLLLLFAELLQKRNELKLKVSDYELSNTFARTLILAYTDNGLQTEESLEKAQNFGEICLEFTDSYIQGVVEKELKKNGFPFYACMYFSKKFHNMLQDTHKYGMVVALINNNRKIIRDYFEGVFKKVKILDTKPGTNAENTKTSKNLSVEFSIEFNQFLTKIKTDSELRVDDSSHDALLIKLLASFTARFFFICDDTQFYLIKAYLNDLFLKDFHNGDELCQIGVSNSIFELIFNSLSDDKKKGVINLFGKGEFFPFNHAPVLIFGKDAYEDNNKPFSEYKFLLNVRDNKVSYKLKMPSLNPTVIFTPLALAYIIEYVYFNLKNEELFGQSKKVILDMLSMIIDRKFNEYNLVNGVLVKNGIC